MGKIFIKNARFVDGTTHSIFVENNEIKHVDSLLVNDQDTKVIELDDDEYVSAGWIDMHTHCFDYFEIYGDKPDEVGYKCGVTSVVDAGTAGANNVDLFYEQAVKSKTNVFSLLNIANTGIYAQDELSNPDHVQIEQFIEATQKYPDFIIGIKARLSRSVITNTGNFGLVKALELKHLTKLPLMIHIGSKPMDIDDLMEQLDKGDIVTHIFNPKDNGILKSGAIRSSVLKAYQRGVVFDLGHGTESYSFDVMEEAKKQGIKAHTISSDIYRGNRIKGPVYNLSTTMSKALLCGYTIEEIIDRVTLYPAQYLHLKKRGSIQEGYFGDLTFFKVIEKKQELVDSLGQKRTSHKMFCPTAVLLKDEYIRLEEIEDGKCI